MPVYNAEAYLRPAIESILTQTFTDFEFLIVNDGSTDRSAEIIRSYGDPRIRLIQQENQGCYPARNRAIQEARGEFLANMDADDISLPDRFEKQIGYLRANPTADLTAVRVYGCDSEDTFRLPQPDGFRYDPSGKPPHSLSQESLQGTPPFACQTMLFRASLVEKMGGYDTRLCFGADVEFVTRAANYGAVACLPEYLYVFRILPSAISGAGSLIQREILRILQARCSRVATGKGTGFTEVEVQRLNELARLRNNVPHTSSRRKSAYYETRLATLLRVNGYFIKAFIHAFRAVLIAPEHLILDHKLRSVIIKALLRL
jgi:glycosyltransferase involved in cell wall biosynthesis